MSENLTRPGFVLRIVLGSMAATAGLLVLGGILSSTSASAADTTPPPSDTPSLVGTLGSVLGSVDNTVSSVATSTTDTVSAVVAPVAEALPAPVASVVDAVAPTGDAVADATQTAIVGQVATPIANTADHVVAAVPGTNQLLGADPVATLTSPTVGTIDGALGAVGGTVSTIVGATSRADDPGTAVVPGAPGNTVSSGPSTPTACVPPAVVALNSAGMTAATLSAFDSGLSDSPQAGGSVMYAEIGVASGAVAPLSGSSGDPFAPPGSPGNPAVTPALSGSGTSGAGGASGPTVASIAVLNGAELSHQLVGLNGLPGDDVLPSSPADSHDSTPD